MLIPDWHTLGNILASPISSAVRLVFLRLVQFLLGLIFLSVHLGVSRMPLKKSAGSMLTPSATRASWAGLRIHHLGVLAYGQLVQNLAGSMRVGRNSRLLLVQRVVKPTVPTMRF